MPVDILLTGPGGDTTITVLHDSSGQEFLLHAGRAVQAVIPDPDHWLLAEFTPTTDAGPAADPLPGGALLLDNYPNPFNGRTTFRTLLHHPSEYTLRICDLLGREVARPGAGLAPAGTLDIPWDAAATATGMYIARLTTGDGTAVRRLLILR
jgi:hypothetical protein